MKVLIVASLNKGYYAPFIVEQVEALRRSGVECEFFGVEGKGLLGYLKNLSKLKSIIKRFKPNVIHAHYGLSGLLANLQRRVPVVTTFHGSDINDPKVLPLSRLAMRLSQYNIFVSQRQLDIVKPKRKYALIPCGINLDDYKIISKAEARKKMDLDENKKYILFAGAFSNEVKNYPLAKASVELLNKDIMLLELKGYSRAEVALLMNAVDVFLMTSFTEGSPQVIKEAMACGCPIVSVDVGDVKEIFGSVQGNFLCLHDAKDLSEKLRFAFAFLGRTNGKERIAQLNLSNHQVVRQIISIYNRILAN